MGASFVSGGGVEGAPNLKLATCGLTVTSGTWNISYSTNTLSQIHNDGTAADNDAFTVKCFLAQGTYTIQAILNQSNVNGILKIKIDGTVVATFDTYNAAETNGNLHEQTSVSVSPSGIKTITFEIDGKNGASGGYRSYIGDVYLIQTG